MGTRGPVPKRTSQRHGHMSEAERQAVEKVTATGQVGIPPADKAWHRVAQDWYGSLADSAQSRFYEPSDWQAARLVAVLMTEMLSFEVVSPTMFKAIWAAMDSLLTTEGARRRVKVEIERTGTGGTLPDGVVSIDDARRRQSG